MDRAGDRRATGSTGVTMVGRFGPPPVGPFVVGGDFERRECALGAFPILAGFTPKPVPRP